ncbi:probable insulin-like peptide 3 [Drosophila grimshawi]|uniref:GH16017 n=1 Tax=Drosophila grimshawi TaxID=7222 RepID=B4J2N6_DROGR|nr:probable insulin-like peptide 3 [Drosophila grimshawi]EDV96027.1 GH16017 [Drosophila grimshawi]
MHLENVKVQCLICSLAFLVLQVDAIRLCGTELPEMLERICSYGYNTEMKRANVPPPVQYNGISNEYAGSYSNLDSNSQPMLQMLLGESAHRHLVNSRHRRFGVYDDCCARSCTYTELASYCRPSPLI